jgi:CelD/BcsL family acetyltransferase involved in cellulose biosynthesis
VSRLALAPESALREDVSVATDLDSLACEWEEFAERIDGSPFLRPGWILPWLRAFGTGTPEAITIRREGELVGVLPMQRRRGRLYSVANWHSPIFGPLLQDDQARDLLLEHLFDGGRTSVELSLLEGDSDLLAPMAQAARDAGRLVLEGPIAACPIVDLEGTFEDYEHSLSRNRRKSLRRGLRQLEAEGRVEFDVHEGLEGLEHVLEETFRVEASGWKGRRGTAIESRAETKRFYTEIAHWAAERGWLRISFLRLDGDAIACDYSIEFDGVAYSLKSGYDEARRACGPGALLLREQLRDCFERRLSAFDLLGVADAFKMSWTDRTCDRARVDAFDVSPVGLAHWSRVAGRDALRPAVRWIRARIHDQATRGHHIVASALAALDRWGLEPMPGLLA